jgi:hypothetical protein
VAEFESVLPKRLPNRQTGSALGISEGTVKFHLANIFAKLGVWERLSAVEVGLPALEEVNSLLSQRIGGLPTAFASMGGGDST